MMKKNKNRRIKKTTQNLIKSFCITLVCVLFPPFGVQWRKKIILRRANIQWMFEPVFVFCLAIGMIAGQASAQNNSIVLDGAYIVLDGGTVVNNIHLVIDQSSPFGIVRLSSGGHIHSENQYNFVTWLSGTNTGSYLFPFGVGGTATDYIPFTFNKTAGNSNISMSTWFTNQQNLPQPAATNVGPVTNMNGITDSVIYAIDRFWDIQAPVTIADLTFSYRGVENTTSNPTNLVQAQHWNGASWDAPVGPGTAGVSIGIGSAGAFIGQNTFSPWVLIATCPTDTLTQNPIICQGDSVMVGTNTYTTTGIFIDTLTNIQGCDSVITTNLTVNPIATSTDVQTACDSLTWIDGNTYTTSTTSPTFTITGGAVNSCDSIITLNLTINPSATFTQTPTICQGQSFTLPGGIIVTSTGTFIDTLQNAAVSGCDSIVTTNLTVSPAASFTQTFTECQGFSITVGSNVYNTTGVFTDTLATSVGCDSIITTNITILIPTSTTNVFNECEGFSVTVGTNTYNTTGIFIDIVNNCDTIISNLTINPAPQLTLIKADDNCGEQIGSLAAIATSNNPPITYSWNTGSTDSVISNLPAGTYSIIVTDSIGCSSINTTELLDLQMDCDFFIYTPNAFTPNGDGNNDVFFVRGKGIETISVQLYNRWGNKVFEINDITQGWDGKYKGAEQNTAVFVFVLEAHFTNGKIITESGDVSLIR